MQEWKKSVIAANWRRRKREHEWWRGEEAREGTEVVLNAQSGTLLNIHTTVWLTAPLDTSDSQLFLPIFGLFFKYQTGFCHILHYLHFLEVVIYKFILRYSFHSFCNTFCNKIKKNYCNNNCLELETFQNVNLSLSQNSSKLMLPSVSQLKGCITLSYI